MPFKILATYAINKTHRGALYARFISYVLFFHSQSNLHRMHVNLVHTENGHGRKNNTSSNCRPWRMMIFIVLMIVCVFFLFRKDILLQQKTLKRTYYSKYFLLKTLELRNNDNHYVKQRNVLDTYPV